MSDSVRGQKLIDFAYEIMEGIDIARSKGLYWTSLEIPDVLMDGKKPWKPVSHLLLNFEKDGYTTSAVRGEYGTNVYIQWSNPK